MIVTISASYFKSFKLNDKGFPLITKYVIGKLTIARLENDVSHSYSHIHTYINQRGSRETNLINYNTLMFSRLIYPALFITVFSIATFYFAFSRVRKNV